MATIEKGEAFIVKRGREYDKTPVMTLFGMAPVSSEPQIAHDRSYEGMVFLAVEVCGSHVAAKYLGGKKWWRDEPAVMFDVEEMELWPVTDAFVAAMGITAETPAE
jgi:hypothetical protein